MLIIEAQSLSGDSVDTTCRDAVKLARILSAGVSINHNGFQTVVFEHSSLEELSKEYFRYCVHKSVRSINER